MIFQDRAYQTECVESIWRYFYEKTGNPVCALPTGTGKSVVIARFLQSIFLRYPTQKVQVLTHVKELIKQNYDKLMAVWPSAPAGINSAGLGQRDIHDRILFAGIGSVAKYWAMFGHVDLVIIDEAHLVSPNDSAMYQKYIAGLKSINPMLKIVGFTATAWRLGHGRITEGGSLFTDLCFDITGMEAFNRLIAEGYLSPLIPKPTNTVLDLKGVHIRGGEYIASELQNAVDKDEITMAALREAMEAGHNRHHWLIFASGVKHAVNIADMLTQLGEPCVSVHSNMSQGERDKNIELFRTGKVRAISNNKVLTTGFDMPGIDLILMLRPTASPGLWVQMLGRGTRPFSCAEWIKENCMCLDFAGNTRRLGPINDPVIPRKKGAGGGDAPIKLCEICSTYNHASVRYCGGHPPPNVVPGYCGSEFPVSVKLKQAASTQELIKGAVPITEVFLIDHITFSEHNKHDRPPAIKVTYYCNLRNFTEYVCFEHEGYASRKARSWWRERAPGEPPKTTAEALALIGGLRTPTHLRVWVNKKYPEILTHCWDGSAFGTQQPSDSCVPPSVEVQASIPNVPHTLLLGEGLPARSYPEDDDIPF